MYYILSVWQAFFSLNFLTVVLPHDVLDCGHIFHSVSRFPPSTWHIYFEAQYTVFLLSIWMWNNYVWFAIDSVILVRCRMLSSDGFTTTFTGIHYKGHGLNLILLIDLEFFLAAFYIEDVSIYYYNFHTQKNNFCHHFGFLWRKQYVIVYWFAVSFPPLFFLQFTVTVGLSTTPFFLFSLFLTGCAMGIFHVLSLIAMAAVECFHYSVSWIFTFSLVVFVIKAATSFQVLVRWHTTLLSSLASVGL